jgi:outer membrane protein assembly factor BamB
MKRAIYLVLACTGMLHAQMGRTIDWFALGGDAARDGWEKGEQKFVKDDVKDFQLLWQRKLDNSKHASAGLLPPVILGNLIGYRGFKELAFVAGSGNSLWSIDADLNRMYWSKHFDIAKGKGGKSCGESLTAAPALTPPFVFRSSAAPKAPAGTVGATAASKPATPLHIKSAFEHFVEPHPVYFLTGDGVLHKLNQSDGSEMGEPIPFVPAGSVAQALNVSEDTVYTSSLAACGQPAAVWSVDTADPAAKVKSIKLGADAAGLEGVALGSDGMAFVQTKYGPLDPGSGKFGGALVALDKDLTVSQYFVVPQAEGKQADTPVNVTSPVVFAYKGTEFVVTANQDGRLYVLQGSAVGSDDHHHYISKSMVVPAMDGKTEGIRGGLSSWEDTDGSRYLLVPVWGSLSAELQAAIPGTDAPNGSIVAFKLEDKDGVATLTPAWVSRDLDSPVPPVIAKGVVFALANGKFSHSEERVHGVMTMRETPRKGTHATLYALDGVTGKEMYSTGDKVAAAGNLTGMSIANGRIYFATVDDTVQVFGKYLEH